MLDLGDPFGGVRDMLQDIVAQVKQTADEVESLKLQMTRVSGDVYAAGGLSHKVHEMEHLVRQVSQHMALERRRRCDAGRVVMEKKSETYLVARYFAALAGYARCHGGRRRRNKAVKVLQERSQYHTYTSCFTAWRRHHKSRQRARVIERTARQLQGRNERAHLRQRFGCLFAFYADHRCKGVEQRAVRTVLSDDLLELNNHTLLSRYFTRLMCAPHHRRETSRLLASVCSALALRYFRTWCDRYMPFRRWAAQRRVQAGEMQQHRALTLVSSYHRKWRAYASAARRHRRAWEQLLFLQGVCARRLVSRYLERWVSLVVGGHGDTLRQRVEVGLSTLANTNSVLDTLVDKIVSLDHTLERMDKEKIGRREMMSVLESASTSPPLRQEPSRPPDTMAALGTARDLLSHDATLCTAVDEVIRGQQMLDQDRERRRASRSGSNVSPPYAHHADGTPHSHFTNLSSLEGEVLHQARSRSSSIGLAPPRIAPAVPHGMQPATALAPAPPSGHGFAHQDLDSKWAAHFADIQFNSGRH